MLSENDKQSLFRNISRNRVVLVTGSGFSADAINVTGEHMPVGSQLARSLWQFLYDSEYDDFTQLKTLYAAAQTHRKGTAALREFLRNQLQTQRFPDWYDVVRRYYWFRIYTFNADDLLENVYKRPGTTRLDRIVAPDDYRERDGFLRTTQYVKLHGSIENDKDLVFGPREYGARAAARADIWYLHFVEDYSTLPTLFVGTALDEPLFAQYVELRGAQPRRGDKVRRPKCYLVTPSISKPQEEVLEQYNIASIRSTAAEFFNWLGTELTPQSRENVLRLVDPTLEPALLAAEQGTPAQMVTLVEHFYSVFRVPVRLNNPRSRGMFLLGSPPTWEDISSDVDAHRDVNDEILATLIDCYTNRCSDVLLISSAAGGGKSTICKRAALELVDRGYSVYFSEGELRPDPAKLASYLAPRTDRYFLFFDNAGRDLTPIADLFNRIKDAADKPIMVIAARSNDIAYRGYELEKAGATIKEVFIPHLTDKDIDAILETLDRHDLLGILKDKEHHDRVDVFKTKARKQILVAMREATSGRGFDEIIRDEFGSVEPAEARLLYLITALASDGNYGLTIQQMITALDRPPVETMILAEKSLAGILSQHEFDATRYFIRHPAIAHFVIAGAPREMLAEALVSLLIMISTVLPTGKERRWSKGFRLYRDAISHRRLNSMFIGNHQLVRQIYEAIKDYYRDDGHYWLQYASFEIEYGGDISLAGNFLDQAAGLLGENRQVQTATAHLLFKKAQAAENASVAEAHADEALKILRVHMLDRQNVSLHALHIFGSQMLNLIWRWGHTTEQAERFRATHQELRNAIPDHMQTHPELVRVLNDLKRAELETVVNP